MTRPAATQIVADRLPCARCGLDAAVEVDVFDGVEHVATLVGCVACGTGVCAEVTTKVTRS